MRSAAALPADTPPSGGQDRVSGPLGDVGRPGARGPRRAGRLPARCARAGVLPGGRAVARAARQAPRRRGNLPGRPGRPRAGRSRPVPCSPGPPGPPAAGAEGRPPGARDRQQKLADRLCGFGIFRLAAPPANTGTKTGTCRQRPPFSVADVQDVAGLNLPVHSQTDISVRLINNHPWPAADA